MIVLTAQYHSKYKSITHCIILKAGNLQHAKSHHKLSQENSTPGPCNVQQPALCDSRSAKFDMQHNMWESCCHRNACTIYTRRPTERCPNSTDKSEHCVAHKFCTCICIFCAYNQSAAIISKDEISPRLVCAAQISAAIFSIVSGNPPSLSRKGNKLAKRRYKLTIRCR